MRETFGIEWDQSARAQQRNLLRWKSLKTKSFAWSAMWIAPPTLTQITHVLRTNSNGIQKQQQQQQGIIENWIHFTKINWNLKRWISAMSIEEQHIHTHTQTSTKSGLTEHTFGKHLALVYGKLSQSCIAMCTSLSEALFEDGLGINWPDWACGVYLSVRVTSRA